MAVFANFEALPDEICSLIFSYLNPLCDNLLQSALVCKRWRNIIYDASSLWKYFSSKRSPCFCDRGGLFLPGPANPERNHLVYARKVTNIIHRFGKFMVELDISNINERHLKKAGIMQAVKQLRLLSIFTAHPLPCERRLMAAIPNGPNSTLREFTARGVMFRRDNGPLSQVPDAVLLELADNFPFLHKLILCDFHIPLATLIMLLEKLVNLRELQIEFTFEDEFHYRGVSSAFLREYRRSKVGLVLQGLAASIFSAKVTKLSLEDVFLTGLHLQTVVENLETLKILELNAVVDENITETVSITFKSNSLKEVTIWDVCYISELHMSLPSAMKVFLSDLNLEAVTVDAPELKELYIGPLQLSNTLSGFELQTGKLHKLEVMELSEHSSIGINELHHILYSNPGLKILELECFVPKIEITETLCPNLNELSVSGSVSDYCISCTKLRNLDIKGDCVGPDDSKQRCISVMCQEIFLLDIHQVPNLRQVVLHSGKITNFSLSESNEIDGSISPKCGTRISLGQGTAIGSLRVTNIKPCDLDCSLDSKIYCLWLNNCCLTGDELKAMISNNLIVKNLTLKQSKGLKMLCLENKFLEDITILCCDDLQEICLECPLARHLRIKDLCKKEEGFQKMIAEIQEKFPQLHVYS